ncbi:putative HTH-type transcriptional regulator YezE [Paenibacillus sp. CCS19]|uniref:TetR/AcrR family transcriptional regulator n=1 Tax=Paenibacillus sp. CCS19 TaxID=3158387 RepID=UPI00256A0340|nr:TetR/AcrR family transcriptional regulator [Paenibacillus cellulosilyticus]GMK37758.1 putative HTH-type transcriptional regulator YezE [Paenibacillus cellulosilyticus]
MVRAKAFDPAAALNKAMHVFWKHGYEKTSVGDLLDALGINRGSLYDTFGDKHTLFLACLNRYSEAYMSRVFGALSQPTPVVPTLTQLFRNVKDLVHEDQESWGCLMVNTANELGIHDAAVNELVTNNFLQLEQAFAGFLEAGKARGEVRAETDTAACARYLVSSFAGIATMAKTDLPASFIYDAVDVTLRGI